MPSPASQELTDLPAAQIRFLAPMRAQLVARLPEGEAWQYEIKFDGYRALALKESGELQLLSRNARALNSRFPKLARALAAVEDGAMLDGEIVALD